MENWLPDLTTPTPTEGYALAVKLSRMAIKMTQPDAEIRDSCAQNTRAMPMR